MPDKLYIVIPAYNEEMNIESVAREWHDVVVSCGAASRLVIIDDGSKDRTGEIADRYAAEHPDIVLVIHQENGGHGEGINQGVRHATGRYFKVVDSDDWVDPASFKRVLDKL